MSKSVRAVFDEDNLIELLFTGKTKISGVKFVLNGTAGWNRVGVSIGDLKSITTSGVAISYGYFELKVEYILQDIGFDRIDTWMDIYEKKIKNKNE